MSLASLVVLACGLCFPASAIRDSSAHLAGIVLEASSGRQLIGTVEPKLEPQADGDADAVSSEGGEGVVDAADDDAEMKAYAGQSDNDHASTTVEQPEESGESESMSADHEETQEDPAVSGDAAPAPASRSIPGDAGQVTLPQLVDCAVEGGTVPTEVLGKLRKCTDALDEFARKVKDQNGRSRDANQRYVTKFKEVVKQLQTIKDVQELNKALSKDQGEALRVLMAQADKAKDEIESLLPGHPAAAAR